MTNQINQDLFDAVQELDAVVFKVKPQSHQVMFDVLKGAMLNCIEETESVIAVIDRMTEKEMAQQGLSPEEECVLNALDQHIRLQLANHGFAFGCNELVNDEE